MLWLLTTLRSGCCWGSAHLDHTLSHALLIHALTYSLLTQNRASLAPRATRPPLVLTPRTQIQLAEHPRQHFDLDHLVLQPPWARVLLRGGRGPSLHLPRLPSSYSRPNRMIGLYRGRL